MRLSPLASVRNWCTTIFLSVAFLSDAFSQAALPINSGDAPRHHGIEQNSVAVYFNVNISGSTSTAQWAVTVNNIAVTVTGVSGVEFSGWGATANPTGQLVSVQFNATNAHAGIPFIIPGDVVRVSFTNTGSTLKTASNNANIANFGPLVSKNYYVPTCANDIIYNSEGVAAVLDQCAPVNTNFYRWTYQYSLRFRNSSTWITTNNRLRVTWGSGASQTDLQGFLSDNGGNFNTSFISPNTFGSGGNPGVFLTFRSGTNPATGVVDGTNPFSYPDNTNVCNFRTTHTPIGVTTAVYDCSASPTLTRNTQFNSYDFDDQNTGTLILDPVTPPASSTTTTDKVCLGTNVGARFIDHSTFNCIGNGTVIPTPSQGAATTPLNNQQRWIRFIYGAIDNASGNIPDIRVNGTPVTDPVTGALLAPYTANPVLAGGPITRGFVVTGAGGVGVPDANGVIELPANAVASNVLSSLITTQNPANQAVGDRFYVTIQYWNVCNPYPTSQPVGITTDYVEIVTKPVPLTTAGRAICYTNPSSTAGINFTVASSIGGARTAVNWYATRALVGTTTKMNNPNGASSLNFPASSYTAANGAVGAPFTTNNVNGKYYSVWATQVAGGTNGCESDPVEVVIFQQPQITAPAAISGEADVCNGPPPVTENYSTNAAGTRSIAITTSTNPAVVNFTLENVWSSTFGAGVSLSGTTGTSIDVEYNIATQPNPNANGDLQVLRRYRTTGADAISVVSPLSAPASVPTYTISPLACATGNTTLNIDVWGQSNGGTISGTKSICDGAATGNLTVTGHRGSIIRWERSFNSTTVYTDIGNAGAATINQTLSGVGTYRYRVVVRNQGDPNGPCPPVETILANQAVITVNPVPTKPTVTPSGATTFCDGGSVTLTAASTNASTYRWYRNGTFTGTTTAAIIVNNIAAAGTYTVEGVGMATTNCVGPLSDPVDVVINPLPTANVSGGGSICSPPPSPAPDIVFTFTGNGPWDLVYSIDGVNQPVVNNVTSPYTITTPGVGVYRIVSVNDNNNCIVSAPHANLTFTAGQAAVVVGGAPPAFDSAPALIEDAVCHNGASTTDPRITFDLTDATASVGNYELTYQVNGVTQPAKTFTVNSTTGVITSVNGTPATSIAFTEAAFNNVGTQTLRILAIKSPSNCQTIINTDYQFTINPLPVGANKTVATGCSPDNINIDIFNTSVATAAGGNNVASTFSWSLALNGLTGMATTGSGATISGTLTNPTAAVVNAVFTITPTSTATPACPGSTFTITVPVQPTPFVSDRPATICSGTAFSINPQTNVPVASGTIVPAGTTYTWTVSANANITGASNQVTGVAAPFGQTLTNTSNVAQSITYTVTPKAGAGVGGCTGPAFEVVVTVDPKPVIPNQTTAICSGATFNVAPANSLPTTIVPAGTTYSWPAPVFTGGITGGSAQTGQASISQTLINPSTSPQTAKYTVTPTSGASGNCVGSAFQVQVTVNPTPALSSSLTPPDICSGTFSYTPTSLTGGATFSWSRPNVPGINEGASSGTGNISETLTNPTTDPVDVPYTIITTANSCPNTGQTVTVRVNPTPLPNAILGPSNVCVSNNPFFYSVTQRPGSTYSWTIPAGFTVEAAGGGAVAGGGPGAFSSDYFILLKFSTPTGPGGLNILVVEKSADGCIGPANVHNIVAATSPPTVPISGGNTFCKFQKGVVFSVPQNASSTFTWTINSGGTIVGPSAGTNLFQIIVDFNNSPTAQIDLVETNITGCPASYPSLIVSLLDAPVITPMPGTICSGDQPSSSVSLPAITSIPSTYSWFVKSITPNITGAFVNDIGTGALQHAPPLRNVSGTNGTIVYSVTPTSTSAPFCMGVPVDITVTVKPEPVVTAVTDQSFCPLGFVNGNVSFPLTSNVPSATINWSSSNPAIGLAAATGTGNITFTAADNTTGADITSIINVTAVDAGCTSAGGNAKTFNLTIKPRPVVTAIADIVVCPGDAVSVPAFTSNTSGGETYAWTNDNAGIGLATSGTGNIAGYFAPANNTGSDIVGNLSVTATRQGCDGPPRTFKITIRPQPVITNVTDKFYCPGESINIPLLSNVAGTTIDWSNSNTSIGLLASGTGDISGTAAVNNTGADITATITVTGTANGCTSTGANIETFTITIRPTPIVDAITDITVCSGANIPQITFGSNITSGGVTFNWTNNNPAINLAPNGSGNIAAFTAAVNTTGVPIVGTIDVTGSKNGCAGPIRQFTVTVNPEPVVNVVALQEFCPGEAASITLGSNVIGATINWSNNNPAIGLGASGTGDISFTAPANNTGANIVGTITVTATANGCTSTGANLKTFQIRIKPTPIMTAISDIAVCSGGPISTIVFAANTGGGETFTWTNDNTAIGLVASGTGNIVGYTAPINISGTPIVANIEVSASRQGCAGPTSTFKITVNPEPVVTAIADQFFCPTDAINIPFVSNVGGASISWTNDNPAIGLGANGIGNISSVAPTNNSGVDIVGNITVTASKDGCASTGANQKTFKITIRPTPIVNSISNITVCSGGTVNVPAFTSNVGSGGVTFNWANDETSIGLGASGTGDITAFVAASNTSSSPMVATITFNGTKNGCAGPSKSFTITILPEPVGTPVTMAICSDAAVGVNLSTLITGGAAAASYNLTIGNVAGLSASAGSPANGNGLPATEILNDKWTNHTGAPADIVYHITPVAGGSPACTGATFDLTVTINPEPVVTGVANQSFCPGDPINIALMSNVPTATMHWTNSNPAVGLGFSGTGDIIYTAPANNTGADLVATITVSGEANGCTSAGTNVKSFTLRIKPSPIVTPISDITVCSGGSISAINFTANTGGSETFDWVNDNVAIGLAGSGVGNIAGYTAPINVSGVPIVANISVTATRLSCIGPVRTFKITVNPEPVVSPLTNLTFCSGDPINVPFTSNVAGATISWTNSNTAIGIGGSGIGDMSFAAPTNTSGVDIVGTINVIATSNTCVSAGANAQTFTITIKPSPVVNPVTSITVCSGGTVPLISFGSNVAGGGVTFDWTNDNTGIGLPGSGTGNIASFTAAVNTTSTPFVANISVTGTKNSCGSITPRTFTITVLPQPVGTPLPITVCSDAAVAVNLSTFITGGAAASTYNITILNPDGLSFSAGAPADGIGLPATEIQNDKWTNHTGVPRDIIYRITPVSAGSPGCAGDPFDLVVTIDPEPVVTAVTDKIFCPGEAMNIPLTSNVGAATINWSNSNPAIGLAFTGTGSIAATAPANNTGADIVGTITVTAEANGCVSTGARTKQFNITIKPTPIVSAVTDVTVCSGAAIGAINFTANTGGGETFNWTNDNVAIGLPGNGIGNIAGYTAPVNISGAPIVANISVSATRLGCSSLPTLFKITVNPEPVVTAIADQAFCAGDPINIPFTSNIAGASIAWTNDNTAVGIGLNGAGDLSFAAGVNNTGADIVGNFVVTASRNGCVSAGANRKLFKITIKPTPIVNNMADITVCSGGTVVVPAFGSNVGAGGVTFTWDNDNTTIGLVASGSGDIATFTAGVNTTGAPITGTITYFGTRLSCVGPSKSFRIIVLPQPVGIPTSVTVCSDAALNVNLASLISGSAASYNVSILNPSAIPASAGNPGNNNGVAATEIQDDRWTNVTGAPVTITYQITPIGAGSPGCVGAQFDLTVTVNPEPVVTAVPIQEFCPSLPVTVPLTSNVPLATISWTNNNPLIGLGFTGSGDISYTTPANNTGADITGTITVTASKDGCVSSGANIKTFDIVIKPTPIINQVSNVVVCSGATIPTINFTSNTGGSETYSWTNSNAGIGLGLNGTVNIPGYTAPINISGAPIVGTISVTAMRNGCQGPPMNFTITVKPEPVVTAVASQAFCAGEAVSIPLFSNVPGATINWTNSNASIGLSGSGTGDIAFTAGVNNTGSDIVGNITVTATKDGCLSVGANAKTFQITIKPTPVVTAISDITVCSGQTVNVPAFASNVVGGGVTFDWTNDNTAILLGASGTGDIASFSAATNISGVPMIANIVVKGTKNSCESLPVSFRIIVNPEPVVTAITDKEFCPGQVVNIPLTSNVAGATISWTNSNTTIGIASSGSGDISFTAPVNTTGIDFVATIDVVAERNGCFSTGANAKTFQITIKATPVVDPITSITVCSGDAIPGIIFASNADPGVTFNWLNDNTTIGLAASGTGNIAGFTGAVNTGSVPMIANITVTGTKNGCTGAVASFKITINPEPVMSVPTPPDVCSRAITNITLGTNGTSVNAQFYRIDQIQYSSNGGPFGVAPPAGFTPAGTNKTVGSQGGTAHINSDVFTNTSPFFVDVQYTITPISPPTAATPAGCPGDAVQVTVRVLPEPDLDDALNPADICSGETIVGANPGYELRADPASVAATSFIIRSINTGGLTAGPSNTGTGAGKTSTAINNDSWINTTNTMVAVSYTIAPVTGTCVGPDEVITVRVNPSPAMKDGLDRIVCSDAESGIVLQDNQPTSVQADRFDIISIQVGGVNIPKGTTVGGLTANGSNADPGMTTDPDEIRHDRFENLTNDRIVVTYTVVPVASAANNNCRGPAKTITLTVEPKVVSVSVNAKPTICSGEAVDITFASPTYSNGNPSNPEVTFSYSTLPSLVSGTTVQNNLAEGTKITDVLVNTTNNPITVHYRIIPRAASASGGIGCAGDIEDVAVVVEPRPRINTIANKTICEGTSVNLTLASNTVPTTGTIKIFVTATADAGIGGFTNNALVNNNTVLGDVLTNSTPSIKFITYHLEVRNVDASNVTICSAGTPIDVVVGVSPIPQITPIANFAICSGDSFDPIPIVTDTETAVPGSTLITWTATPNPNVSGESNGAGNSFSQVLFNTTSDKQTVIYNISATNINSTPSCIASPPTELHVTVYPNPRVVGLPSSVNVCNNGTLSPNPYVLTPSTVAALGTTFDWTVDNGGNPDLPVIADGVDQTSINQTFVNNGSFLGTQQYTIKAHLTMAAADNPLIDTSITDAVCEAQQDAVMVVNVAPPVNGDIYGFDIDGNQANEIYLCRGAKQFVYIDPVGLPLMDVTYSENGTTKTLTKLGGLNVLQVSPANTTTYELLTVKDKFGCVQTINKTVTVNVDEVDNNFAIVGPDIACSPFPVTFQHNQVAGTSYTWKWLDGPDSTTYHAASSEAGKLIKHVYTNPSPGSTAKFRASLDAFLDTTKYLAGCRKKPVVVEVRVHPTVSTAVFPDKDVICSDESVAFVNSSQGVNATGHRWFYRVAGSTAELDVKTTPNVTFKIPNTTTSNPIVYEVVYQATNGNCPAPDVVMPITVYRGVDAHFAHTVPTVFVGGHSNVTFTNDSEPVDGTDFRYEWDFGLDANPATAQGVGPTFNLDYTTPGPKEVKLVAINIVAESAGLMCADQYTEMINIIVPPLIADFTAVPLEACFPTDITITENRATGDKFAWRVLDNAGTAAQSNADLPVFKIPSPGKYTIELTTTNSYTGDQKTATKDVIIYNLPMASFDLRPGVVYVPDTEVLTYNFSDGATSYSWDFGDGSTSDEKEPTYKYRIEGVYDVTLIAVNDHGNGVVCSDTLSRKITAKQGGVTRVPNAFTPNPNGPTSSAGTPGIPGSNSFNDVFLPQVKGAEEFNMQIFDRWGNLIFESNNSNIGWDGYDRNGKLMPMGVYVYKLTLRLSDGQRTTQVGDITMIR